MAKINTSGVLEVLGVRGIFIVTSSDFADIRIESNIQETILHSLLKSIAALSDTSEACRCFNVAVFRHHWASLKCFRWDWSPSCVAGSSPMTKTSVAAAETVKASFMSNCERRCSGHVRTTVQG